MKKFYGIMTIMLVFAVMLGFTAVKAYTSPSFVGMCVTGVEYGSFSKGTGYYTKNKGGAQSFRNDKAKTSLTNPCKDCQIAAKVFLLNPSAAWSGAAAKMGQTKDFPGGSTQWYGDYKLMLMRADFTLLKTDVDFTWFINS